MNSQSTADEELKVRLNKETAKIDWHELQRFYASGSVIAVETGMDLIEVACQLSADNISQVEQWLNDGRLFKPTDQQAKKWFENESEHWVLVIAPWVLVQQL